MLIYTTNNRAMCVSSSERQYCETLLSYRWTHRTSPRGWTPPSQISPITVQRRSDYENNSFHFVTKGADSEQPVGAPYYQRVGCRDHAGMACFPHSGSWKTQGGPAYICRDQRKHISYNMGPLKKKGSFDIVMIIIFLQRFLPKLACQLLWWYAETFIC